MILNERWSAQVDKDFGRHKEPQGEPEFVTLVAEIEAVFRRTVGGTIVGGWVNVGKAEKTAHDDGSVTLAMHPPVAVGKSQPVLLIKVHFDPELHKRVVRCTAHIKLDPNGTQSTRRGYRNG